MDTTEIGKFFDAVARDDASFEQRAALESCLLGVLEAGGVAGLRRLLATVPEYAFVEETADETGAYRFAADAGALTLEVSGLVGDEIVSVGVMLVPAVRPDDQDPRHVWFYRLWQGMLGIGDKEVQSLTPTERAVFLVGLLESEVMNGGLGQYLSNTEGGWAAATLELLEAISARETRKLLSEALDLGLDSASFAEAWDTQAERFSALDARFMVSGEDLAALTADRYMPDEGTVQQE